MQQELERFVASLAIPADRKAVVLAELIDHVTCAREAATREGRDPDIAERAALGNLEALRASLERVEPAFRITRSRAMVHGIVAGALVAIEIDQIGPWLGGSVAAALAIALAIVAEVAAVTAGRSGGSLRDRQAALHARASSPDVPSARPIA